VHQPRIRLVGPWRWLSDFGDHTHCPSEDAKKWLMETARVPESRITVIPHGVDPDEYPLRDRAIQSAARKSLDLPPAALVAAFVGRLDVPKNAGWMIDLAKASPKVTILMAGDGPEMPELRRVVERECLSRVVRLLGECDPIPVYQAADALLSPSEREGFGLVCAEAMCMGVPVLRTRTGGAAEMIVEGLTGRTTPVDRHEFVEAAIEFLEDLPALQRMGTAAAEHIRANFTLAQQIERTIGMYRKLTGK